MRSRVYLETSVISYLTARPSRDLVQTAHQQITREWWDQRRKDFDLFISEVVLREAGEGDPIAAARRIEMVEGFPVLDVTAKATEIAEALIAEGPLPEKAADDALHLATATVHDMDYLVTWNCTHLANAEMADGIERVLNARGFDLTQDLHA